MLNFLYLISKTICPHFMDFVFIWDKCCQIVTTMQHKWKEKLKYGLILMK